MMPTLAEIRADVRRRHPDASTAAVNATARNTFRAQGLSSVPPPGYVTGGVGGTPTPAIAYAPAAAQTAPGVAVNGYAAGSDQARALANPNVPYAPGGVFTDPATGQTGANATSWTPAEARQWWDQYFRNPVDLNGVNPNLLPGSLVLSSDEIARARSLNAAGNTLPKAGYDYNPLGKTVDWTIANANSSFLNGFATAQPAYRAAQTALAAGGNAASLMPNPLVTSPVTPGGTGTPYSSAVTDTGTAGGVSVSGGGADAGSGAIGGAFPQLGGMLAGLPITDILLLGGAAFGVWYLARHGKRGKAAPKKGS